MGVLDNELPEGNSSPSPLQQPRILPKEATKFLKTKPPSPQTVRGAQREWTHKQGIGYQLAIPDIGLWFDLTRLHASRDDVSGLLTIRAKIAGARTVADDILSSADFNISSLRARQERAKHLAERARADEIDWLGLLEELCLRVLTQEEIGSPEIPLSEIPPPSSEHAAEIIAGGMPLLRRHPVIWFGDGAAGKSLLALYAAIDLAQTGHRVLYCDWEFSGEEHADRLRRFLGPVPGLKDALFYRRCERPFIREITQIREVLSRRKITYMICDSIGFAAEGPPEAAEAATGYFRALRECGPIGSLHLAHMNRSEQGDKKPFGSIFWHAGARSTWNLKRTGAEMVEAMTVGFYHRKANIGRLQPDFGQRVEFFNNETRVSPCDIAKEPELAENATIWQRIAAALEESKVMSTAEIADELKEKEDTIRKTLGRGVRDGKFLSVLGSDGLRRFSLVTNEDV